MKIMNSFCCTLLTCFCLLASTIVVAQNTLPLSDQYEVKPLRGLLDESLQTNLLNEVMKNSKWRKLIDSKRLAIGVVDLKDADNPRYAAINGNHMMYAASLPKIAVLLASMDAIENKEIIETAEVKSDLRLMISKSSNAATTRMINRLGFDKIETVMLDPKYEFYDEDYGGGLWVGKRYGKGGDTNREPLKNLSHAATASQVCRFYYLMAYGKLVSRERSAQMLDYMKNPDLKHKFVSSLRVMAPKARLYRKSGTWKSYHSDSVLVWGENPKRRYIMVALVDDASGEQVVRNIVKKLEPILMKN